jgi:hypothetical protein
MRKVIVVLLLVALVSIIVGPVDAGNHYGNNYPNPGQDGLTPADGFAEPGTINNNHGHSVAQGWDQAYGKGPQHS